MVELLYVPRYISCMVYLNLVIFLNEKKVKQK